MATSLTGQRKRPQQAGFEHTPLPQFFKGLAAAGLSIALAACSSGGGGGDV